jgi:GYF domain 2
MTEERWYYLHESRQIGPCSGSELHALLAKGVISPSTSVWSRNTDGWRPLGELSDQPVVRIPWSRLKWAAFTLAVVMLGITVIASELTSNRPKVGDGQESSASKFTETPELIQTATPPQVVSSTRAALSGEARVEMEFWRSIVGSNDADLYEIYLYRYPGGTFADIATTKMKEFGVGTKAASVDQDDFATSPVSNNSSKPVNRKRAAKTTGHCWNGNIQECRERCRTGELRACQILSKRSR